MTTRRPIYEKIVAVCSTFSALVEELEGRIELTDPRVQASLLDAATALVMGSDTSSMISPPRPLRPLRPDPEPTTSDMAAMHDPWCRCTGRPWCEPHESVMGACADHEHHDG